MLRPSGVLHAAISLHFWFLWPVDFILTNSVVSNDYDNGAGMKIRPEAARIMNIGLRNWIAFDDPEKGQLYLHAGHYKYEMASVEYLPAKMIPVWKSFYRDFLYNGSEFRRRHLDEFVEVRTLGEGHRVEALRGQKGVFARKRIQNRFPIGAYAGMIIRQGSSGSESVDYQAEVEWLAMHYSNITYTDVARYGIDFSASPPAFDRPGDKIIISAFGRGNAMSLINSYWAPPETGERDAGDKRFNTASVQVRMRGHLPLTIFYAIRNIAAGEELLTDYGAEYWAGLATVEAMTAERLIPGTHIAAFTSRFSSNAEHRNNPWLLFPLELPDTIEAVVDELKFQLNVNDLCVSHPETTTLFPPLEPYVEVQYKELLRPKVCPRQISAMTKQLLERFSCCLIRPQRRRRNAIG